ncbi:MAG: efflux RND transporter periplasmic adaptor subunit [Candidatus Muiribacteriaceae bacterium]
MKKIAIILVVVLIAGGVYWKFFKKSDENGKTQIKYRTEEVKKGDIEKKILTTGSISPFTEVSLRSTVRGRLEEVTYYEGDDVKKGDLLAAVSSEERNAIIDAAQSQLNLAIAGGDPADISEAEEALKVAENAYKPVYITSTIDGEIINRNAEVGQNVDLTSQLYVIADRLVARVDVDEVDIAKITNGMPAHIRLEAYPEDIVEAEVSKISREGKVVSNVVVYEILVEPVKVPSTWASGMTANIDFIIAQKHDIPVIPASAYKQSPKGKGGFVLVRDDTSVEPEKRKVSIGISDGKNIEIIKGLDLGEKVVTETIDMSKKGQNGLFMRGRRK